MSNALAGTGRRFERLRFLTEVSRALTYATTIEEVLDLVVKRAAELVDAERSVLMLAGADGLLSVRASHGVDAERLAEVHEAFDETLVRRLRDILGYRDQESFLSVPLVARGDVIGLLAAVRPGEEAVTGDDEWLLSALADQASVALENARLAEAVVRERDERWKATEAEGRARATLGHELRSPLNAIQSYSNLLLESVLGSLSDRQREAISRIRMSGEHLLAVIEDIQDMARIYAGAVTMASSPVAAEEIVTEAIQLVQPRASERDQDVRADLLDVVVPADRHRLRQALVNLLDNAIKFTPAGGDIRVHMETPERDGRAFAAIAVSDDGRGIPASELPTIFDPYERGRSEAHEGGLGLGLAISRELVRRMGGDIEVQSEPGRGSTFTILLPVAAEPEV